MFKSATAAGRRDENRWGGKRLLISTAGLSHSTTITTGAVQRPATTHLTHRHHLTPIINRPATAPHLTSHISHPTSAQTPRHSPHPASKQHTRVVIPMRKTRTCNKSHGSGSPRKTSRARPPLNRETPTRAEFWKRGGNYAGPHRTRLQGKRL
jgi:hypothetical protein